MDIHHVMMVRSSPERLDQVLTQTIQFQYDQGQHTLKIEITHLEENSKRLL